MGASTAIRDIAASARLPFLSGEDPDLGSDQADRLRAEMRACLEARGGEVVDQGPVHLAVEVEVEAGERAFGVPKTSLLRASLEEAVLPAQELVRDDGRDEIEGGCLLALRLVQACLDGVGHAREP